MDLPDVLPLFPLPNVVHFPGVLLPLHVFEERYRSMVRDVLESHRLIGMVLLRAGWEPRYYESPAVFDVGTAGEVVRADPLDDGRWNIVLRGLREFSISGEEPAESYRVAHVRWRQPSPETLSTAMVTGVWGLAREYLTLSEKPVRLPASPETGSDPLLIVNTFAQQLDLPPIERQALLEAPDLAARATRLAAVLEFQIEMRRGSGGAGSQTLQ